MNIKHLSAFLAVAESRSFTKAARSLGLAQPTVTARIKALEQSLDASLLDRTTSGVRLTPAGRRLHCYASRIVRLSDLAQQALSDEVESPLPLLVGSAECITTYRLVPLIEYLHLRYPALDLSLRTLDDDPLSLVRDEQIDCAFFIGARTVTDEVNQHVLRQESLTLVAHPSHPLADTPVRSTEDLSDHTVVCAHRSGSYQRSFESALTDAGVETADIVSLGSIDAVKRGVGEGIGMALLPTVTVAEELRFGQLRRIDWDPPFDAYAQCVWRRGLDDDSVFRTVLATARQVMAEQSTDAYAALSLQAAS